MSNVTCDVRHLTLKCLVQPKYPNRTALRNLGELPREKSIQGVLHSTRVATPSRHDGDVLFSIDGERRRRRQDSGVRRKLPQQLARRSIECMKLTITRSSGKHESSPCGKH